MQLALVTAGLVNGTLLARNPALCKEVGPVIAPSIRLASRVTNTLRTGYATRDWHDLAKCPMWLFSAPDDRLDRLVGAALETGIDLRARTVLLVDSRRDSGALAPFRGSGAVAASILHIGRPERAEYMLEGDATAVRRARGWLQGAGLKVHIVPPSTRHVYSAATLLASHAALTLLDTAVDCLRDSGIGGAAAHDLLTEAAGPPIRAFLRGGRRLRRPVVTEQQRNGIASGLRSLRQQSPALASNIERCLRDSQASLAKEFDWLRGCVKDPRTAAAD